MAMLSVDNPATGEIFCEIETASAEDAAQIVGRARAAADTLAELDLAERVERPRLLPQPVSIEDLGVR